MSNLFSLESKVAVVTGAARGNGKAITEGLREHGAQVIGLDIIEKPLSSVRVYIDVDPISLL